MQLKLRKLSTQSCIKTSTNLLAEFWHVNGRGLCVLPLYPDRSTPSRSFSGQALRINVDVDGKHAEGLIMDRPEHTTPA